MGIYITGDIHGVLRRFQPKSSTSRRLSQKEHARFIAAAHRGNSFAMYNLGNMHQDSGPVEADTVQAVI